MLAFVATPTLVLILFIVVVAAWGLLSATGRIILYYFWRK